MASNLPGLNAEIALTNKMTPVLQNVISTMNILIRSAQDVNSATGKMFDPGAVKALNNGLLSAEIGMRQIEAETIKAQEAHMRYNQEIGKSDGLMGNLKNKLIGLAGVYGGMRAVKAFVGMSDDMTNIETRLGSIRNGFASTNDFIQDIYKSAQESRGEFMMTADIVSKLGSQAKKSFADNNETIKFAKTLNQVFSLSGTSAQGMESVMYNLTQAMGSGVLRGQDLNAVMSNTPQLMEIVAEHMGTGIENIRKLAEEGKLSASVIKEALLEASETIDKRFQKTPMTFRQIGTMTKNQFIMSMQPAFRAFNAFLNTERFKRFSLGASKLIGDLATGIAIAVNGIVSLADLGMQAWEKFKVPILVVAGAMAFYNTQLLISNGLEALHKKMVEASATSKGLLAVATGNLTVAQWACNNAMLASPLFWIPAIILGAVTALTLYNKSVYKSGDATYSVVSGVVGTLFQAGAFIGNLAINLANSVIGYLLITWNKFALFANFLGNVFNKPVASIKVLFYDLLKSILDTIGTAARAIDTLLGSNLSGSLSGFESKVSNWKNKTIADSGYKEYVKSINVGDNLIKRIDYGKAYNSGYAFGEKMKSSLKNKLMPKLPELDQNGVAPVDPITGEAMKNAKDLAKNGKKTADNTKKIKDHLDQGINIKNEDLKYLRELATARAIDQYSIGLDKVMVEVNNSFGDVHETADLDGWQKGMVDGLKESIYRSVEGGGLATT